MMVAYCSDVRENKPLKLLGLKTWKYGHQWNNTGCKNLYTYDECSGCVL